VSDIGDPFDRHAEAPYGPPAWVKEWDGEPDVLMEHAGEVDDRVADWLFLSIVGGVRGRPLRRFQHDDIPASGDAPAPEMPRLR
jgi:hypothetical protein